MTETVNHPAHYGGEDNPYEAIKVIEALGLNFNLDNAMKYLLRAGKKGSFTEDLSKARWYVSRELKNEEEGTALHTERSTLGDPVYSPRAIAERDGVDPRVRGLVRALASLGCAWHRTEALRHLSTAFLSEG